MLKRLRYKMGAKPETTICLILFSLGCLIYFINGSVFITSNDNVPNSLLALNWFEYQTLNFDAFRSEAYYKSIGSATLPYFFVEAPNGHLTSSYPIGTALLSFPIYAVLYAGLRLVEWGQSAIAGTPVDLLEITSTHSFPVIYSFQKIAATLIAAFSVVLFYLLIRLKFKTDVCLAAAFIFAFATTNWAINSQGLWQHSVSNLALLSLMLCLFKANRTTGARQNMLLLTAGFFSGLLPGIRPTSTLFLLAAIAYVVLNYSQALQKFPALFQKPERALQLALWSQQTQVGLSGTAGIQKSATGWSEQLLFFGLGLLSLGFNAAWNFYYFGVSFRNFFYGGYSSFSGKQDFAQMYYRFTWDQFQQGFFGHLVSPSRGLLIFSPILILSIPGFYHVWKQRQGKDEKLVVMMAIAGLILFLQYCFFTVWAGGASYGPRYMTDLLPILCLLLAYYLSHFFQQIGHIHQRVFRGISALILVLTLYSTIPQFLGVFSTPDWNGIPGNTPNRVWWWRDSQMERHAWHLWFKWTHPIPDRTAYIQQFAGEVVQIEQANDRPFTAPLKLVKGQGNQGIRRSLLTVRVKNLGPSEWHGYKRGNDWTIPMVRMRLYASDRPDTLVVEPQYLYVAENTKPGETTLTYGRLRGKLPPGSYQVLMDMMLPGEEPLANPKQSFSVPVLIQD